MALSIDYLYRYYLKLIRKNQSGSINGAEFAFYFNDQSDAYMSDLLGRFQNRSNGKTGNNTGLIENETILTKLTPFTRSTTLAVSSGIVAKPEGFIYRLSLTIGGYLVELINHDQVPAVNHSVIDAPSATTNTYYCTEYTDDVNNLPVQYYSFLPTTVSSAVLKYIKAPIRVKWGYTLSSEGQQVYNSGDSVQPEWDDVSCMEIVKRMLKLTGVSLKDKDFENAGMVTIQTGE
jgi:hypothetical protein